MKIDTIISVGVFALSVITSIISIVIAKFKKNSELESYKSKVGRTEKIISLIGEIIPQAMIFAENNGVGGENKKLLALSKIMVQCFGNNINYAENNEVIDDAIEKLISFSKSVNADKLKEVTK